MYSGLQRKSWRLAMADLLSEDAPAAAPPAAPHPAAPAAAAPPPAAAPPAAAPPPPAPPTIAQTAERLAPDATRDFLKTLPKDLQENPSLSRYSNTEGLARAYVNLERTLGTEKVPIPKDPNDQEAWDRYYTAGGRPAEPAAYSFQKPDVLPDGMVWDEAMEGWWRGAAFESGLNQRQAQKLVDQYRDRYAAHLDLQNKQVGNDLIRGKAELQRDWGSEFEARRALARAAFNEMPADLQKFATDTGMARMPSFVKYLYEHKKAITGERAPRPPGEAADASPDAIRSQIASFRGQHNAALADRTHPEHDLRLEQLTALHNRLFVDNPT